MSFILRGLVAMATAGALSFPSNAPVTQTTANSARRRAAGPTVTVPAQPQKPLFTESDLEFYLNDDGIAYVRPGLKLKVNSITIGADRKPVVDISFTDNFDQPLDRLGKVTPGVVSASMILAAWDPATREYTSYTTRVQTTPASSPRPGVSATQAGTDSGGAWTDLEVGHSRYVFRTVLPAGFNQAQTLTLGIYSTRNLTDIIGKNYYANLEYDFRGDSQKVTETWDKINTATCNNCHDPLAAHGGSRRDLKLCVLCHNPQTVDPDTGESQDMEILVHKIHRGANLPSVIAGKPYVIIGNSQSVHDYSSVIYPQNILNCDNCHEGITPAQKTTQSQLWYTTPTKDACFACHDNINLVTGEGHPGGARSDNATCATCHVPDSGKEFDTSIKGAHVIPEKSAQLKGLNAQIVSATGMKPGEKPTVIFKLTNNDATAVDGSKLTSFAPMIAGPTASYSKYYREAGATRAVFDAATGNTTYTFTAAIPADAKGTWTVSGDFYRNSTLKRNDGEADITLREAAFNPIKYYALTGSVVARRTVATTAQCNQCHDRLALHGGQRLNVDECVICHNPVESDKSRRPAAAGAPESVSFQRMIHRIHRGEELTQDYTVYGFGGTAHNYNEVVYPGDLRNCAKCHTAGSQNLPSAGDPVITELDYFSPQGPGTAACLGCHDNRDTAAHAFLNTTTLRGQPAEACGTCHGANADKSADRSHAR